MSEEIHKLSARAKQIVDEVLAEFAEQREATEPDDADERAFKQRARDFMYSGVYLVNQAEDDREDAWPQQGKPTLTLIVGWAADNPIGRAAGSYGYGKLANAWLSLGWPVVDTLEDENDDEGE